MNIRLQFIDCAQCGFVLCSLKKWEEYMPYDWLLRVNEMKVNWVYLYITKWAEYICIYYKGRIEIRQEYTLRSFAC